MRSESRPLSQKRRRRRSRRRPFFSHTCARYNKVENEEKETGKKKHEEEEKEMKGTEPLSPLPYFPQDHDWPEPLKSILSFAKTPAQHDVLLLGAMTVLAPHCRTSYAASTGTNGSIPACRPSSRAMPPQEECTGMGTQTHRAHTRGNTPAGGGEHEAYRKELRAYEALGKARKDKEPPVAPPNRMFIIPGNNTARGCCKT